MNKINEMILPELVMNDWNQIIAEPCRSLEFSGPVWAVNDSRRAPPSPPTHPNESKSLNPSSRIIWAVTPGN